MGGIAQTLEGLVGAANVHRWEHLSDEMKAKLSAAVLPDCLIECVVFPQSEEQLATVMAWLHQEEVRSLLFGGGTKLKWGGLAGRIQVAVSTAQINRLIDHAAGDLTVTAEAGMRLADLQAILSQKGQFLALDPSFDAEATLGGIVATADSGALRQRYGGVRDMLIGISVVRADGKVAKAGGRVVKNVAGYDLMKLFTGSWGTLGALSQVTFRVYPLPETSTTVVLTGAAEQLSDILQTLLVSALTPTALELVAASAIKHLGLGTEMGVIARFQSIPVSVAEQVEQLASVGSLSGRSLQQFSGDAETSLWQQLRETWEAIPQQPVITCKIGVLPVKAAFTLEQITQMLPSLEFATIHAGSGLGLLRFPVEPHSQSTLLEIRRLCESQAGYLSVLEAPVPFKQQFDVWGYSGSALALMKGIKQQFDPKNLLSPQRFVGGI